MIKGSCYKDRAYRVGCGGVDVPVLWRQNIEESVRLGFPHRVGFHRLDAVARDTRMRQEVGPSPSLVTSAYITFSNALSPPPLNTISLLLVNPRLAKHVVTKEWVEESAAAHEDLDEREFYILGEPTTRATSTLEDL